MRSSAGSACRGLLLREVQALWATTPANTTPPAMANATCKVLMPVFLEVQVDSAMDTADSMSTATIRDTPCSCMVTPMSCSAISMAILLWEMNKN